VKTSNAIAHVMALLAVLTGALNVAPVRVYSLSAGGYKAPSSHHDVAKVKESYSRIPLSFVANHGQADKKVKFISRARG
jgi:hypothetical protein